MYDQLPSLCRCGKITRDCRLDSLCYYRTALRFLNSIGVQLDVVDEESSSHRSHRYEDTEGSSSHRHRQRVLLEEERKDFDHNETFQADSSLMLEMASSLPNGKSTLSVKQHAHHQLSQSVPIPVTNDEVVINPVFSKVL